MPDPDDQNYQNFILDFINDPVIPHPEAIVGFAPFKSLD